MRRVSRFEIWALFARRKGKGWRHIKQGSGGEGAVLVGGGAAPSLTHEPGRLLDQQRRHLQQVFVDRPTNICVTSPIGT